MKEKQKKSEKAKEKKKPIKFDRVVPDTSVIIEGMLSDEIKKGKAEVGEIIIHEGVLSELEHQANLNKETGWIGLDEIIELKKLAEKKKFNITFSGTKPRASEIRHAKLGEIDSMIRDLAYETDATLFTADKVQAKVAEAKGIRTYLLEIKRKEKQLMIEKYFDDTTMSIHLKENTKPSAKKGMPGKWEYVFIDDNKVDKEKIKKISKEIIEEARARKRGFIEIERPGSTIIQLGEYRIVITRPPFSDGYEITAVKPIKKLNIDDYNLSPKLKQRILKQAEGILIAGSPGMGKTTFAQALAEFYSNQNKIVKTVEAPRDLQLPDQITQYAISYGTAQEIHDILLLSRPDYTIFDEMRNTEDFKLFSDMRLAGVGMVGVVHATNPVDAIQRFIGRVELGVIPQIIDTVIFIKNGKIENVLSIRMTVKVPTGMTEADLARPLVVVENFETHEPVCEIYSYGEETVVIPVKEIESKETPLKKLASQQIKKELQRYTSNIGVEFISESRCVIYVPEKDIPSIIGRNGKQIEKIENRLGVSIDVRPLKEMKQEKQEKENKIDFNIKETTKYIELYPMTKKYRDIDIWVNNDYLITANIGKKGLIRIKKTNKIGKTILNALREGEKIKLYSSVDN